MHYTVLQILFLEISNTFMSFIASKFHHINNYLLIILLVNLNFLQSLYDGLFYYHPVGKIAKKAVCRSVFLTIWLAKMHFLGQLFSNFAHWA